MAAWVVVEWDRTREGTEMTRMYPFPKSPRKAGERHEYRSNAKQIHMARPAIGISHPPAPRDLVFSCRYAASVERSMVLVCPATLPLADALDDEVSLKRPLKNNRPAQECSRRINFCCPRRDDDTYCHRRGVRRSCISVGRLNPRQSTTRSLDAHLWVEHPQAGKTTHNWALP